MRLDGETPFMLWEPAERPSDPVIEETRIAMANAGRGIILVAEAQDRDAAKSPILVGFISAERGWCRRNAHTAQIVLGVLEAYTGRGIGTALIAALVPWAATHGVRRLVLTVRADNTRARRLYTRVGYVEEGTLRDALRVDDRYVDEIAMAKLL
jgi:RimJ/RimL family protein N-acetyltransferase